LTIKLVAAITSGLAHAHARGILHRDLKPANILLTDDMQPMILDFNLSQNIGGAPSSSSLIGGTLPYMAPEHLRATMGAGRVDTRSDVYAIGVMLFEMLTGQLPFATDAAAFPESLDAMIRQRYGQQPSARSINPQVSLAVDSIIRRCLEPDATRRYQSAAELLEDLQCQRSDLPLKFAPDRSWRERSRKWIRRHPRLASAGGLSVVAGGIILLMAAALIWRGHRLNRMQAVEQFRQFQSLAPRAVIALSLPGKDAPPPDRALALGTQALALYSVGEPDWQSEPIYQSLPDGDRQQLRATLKELLYRMASAEQTAARAEGPDGKQRLDQALAYNAMAQNLGDGGWRRPLRDQQSELEDARGRSAVAERLRRAARQDGALLEPDDYLAALPKVLARQYAEALPLLQRYTCDHPENSFAWFLLGNCYFAMKADQDAEVCYTHCLANVPEAGEPYVWRGIVRLQLGRWAQAEADFTEALRRHTDPVAVSLNRARARERQGRLKEAIDDYTAAIERGRNDSLTYLLRSNAYYGLGDDERGDRDLHEGLRREPIDDDGWVLRSAKRFAMGDADGALADVDRALLLNPTSSRALRNRALILANALERFGEAIESLDRVLQLEPQDCHALVMRGLLKARMEDRRGAINDARRAVRMKPAALTFYQAAMILATAAQVAEEDSGAGERDGAEAVRLLSIALELNPQLARDAQVEPELAPLRGRADFLELFQGVADLQQADASLTSSSAVD
jgi:tetratricopeptide (TPR) repeat protein